MNRLGRVVPHGNKKMWMHANYVTIGWYSIENYVCDRCWKIGIGGYQALIAHAPECFPELYPQPTRFARVLNAIEDAFGGAFQ